MNSFYPNDVAPRDINVEAEGSAALNDTAAPILPAGLAANLDLLTDHVPEGSIAAPTEAVRATWTQALTKIGDIKDALGLRTRVAGWTGFAMGALLYWHSPDRGFSHAFGSGKFAKPGSNRAFACAASALYGLDVGDADHGTANSKRVNSKATQFDGLLKFLRDQEIRIEDMPLSRASVQLLVSLIEEAGGLNALERLTERDKDSDWAPEPLELDPRKKSVILQARALSALQDGSDVIPKLVFVHKKEDGTEQELSVPDNIVSLAVAAQAPTPPRTQAFAELLEMGGCVLSEPTDELKTKASDPNDGRTEWRIDEGQVVWDPDQRIIQGLLKATSGTVVVECWNHEPTIILGARVEGDTRLYTQIGKRIKVNILDRERRPVFDVDVEATEKKSGVGMLKVSSAAANPSKPIRALLQRLTGEGFVDVDPSRLKASAHCEISRGVLHGFASAYIEKADKAVRNASKPRSGKAEEAPGSTVEFGSDGITVQSAKVDAGKKPVAGKVQGAGSISVRLDDLTAFLKAFIAVYPEVNTEVKCSLGDRVLIWEFGTTSARYRVMIPQANRGARSDGFTTPLVRREWPEGVVLRTIATA